MAETVTIEGQSYLKRNPLGVLGLTFITLGIYFFVWYYKINKEIRAFERDDTIHPTRSLMAMIFGWLIIVPPFIAMYNTANHVQKMEQRVGVQQTLEPAIAIILMFVFSIGNGIYIQEHLNRAWDRVSGAGTSAAGFPPPPPGP
jgi:H+/Cl- antiporter ClcA